MHTTLELRGYEMSSNMVHTYKMTNTQQVVVRLIPLLCTMYILLNKTKKLVQFMI